MRVSVRVGSENRIEPHRETVTVGETYTDGRNREGSVVLNCFNNNNKHNCVLSNAALSNALNKTGFCTSLKSGFYFRFHSPSNTKSASPNFICTYDLMLISSQMCSPEAENCRNQNPHTSKIGKLLPVCVTNRRRCDISDPHPLKGFGT